VSVSGTLAVVDELKPHEGGRAQGAPLPDLRYALDLCDGPSSRSNVALAHERVRADLCRSSSSRCSSDFAWYFSFSIFPARQPVELGLDMAYLMKAVCVLPQPLPLAVASRRGGSRVPPAAPASPDFRNRSSRSSAEHRRTGGRPLWPGSTVRAPRTGSWTSTGSPGERSERWSLCVRRLQPDQRRHHGRWR